MVLKIQPRTLRQDVAYFQSQKSFFEVVFVFFAKTHGVGTNASI